MNTRWQLKYFQALAALLVAAGEALAQERRIVIGIPDRKLALVADGRVVKIFPVAVGAARTPSPAGSFTVAVRISHPTWYGPGRIVPPGKRNPLGPRWIGLSRKGYGIHGTSNPRSIGLPASHGCIRMRNPDVEELFEQVQVGDPVELYAERTDEIAHIFGAPIAVENVASKGAPAVAGISGRPVRKTPHERIRRVSLALDGGDHFPARILDGTAVPDWSHSSAGTPIRTTVISGPGSRLAQPDRRGSKR
jgi:L,D-transpeptidase catalytic domain